jgi:3-deoxy-D-manno-octulosonate 8-phosphate phosphatase (KDO 8-P phosphatase)
MTKIKNFKTKCKKIKLVLTDVDGVLTDGGRYYSKKGEEIKKFHVRDGMGVNLLLRNGIKTAIVTKENSLIVKKWAKDMNISKTYSGVLKKEKKLSDIYKHFKLTAHEIAYVGDDVNDLELLNSVGFSATPSDGILNAKKIVDYVCISKAGEGAFREICDLILSIQFPNKTKWY